MDTGMEPNSPDCQTLLFAYPSHFQQQSGYVRPVVKMEFGAASEPWPGSEPTVRPVIADHFPQAVEGADTMVHALATKPTLWEKAILLREET